MATVNWDSVDPKPVGGGGSPGKGGSLFLKLEAGKVYTIRPVGKPYELRRYFVTGADGKRHFAITSEIGDNCIIQQKYRDADGNPEYPQRVRYAFNCFDRNDIDTDSGIARLKIIEVTPTVARFIRDWGEARGVNPGGGQGADFQIKVTRQGDDPRATRYEPMPLDRVAFTEDEINFLDKKGVHDLEEMFAATSQSEIEEKLGLSGGSATAATATVSASVSSVDDDDMSF